MKKTLLYSLAAFVGLAFASCNGDYDDWSAPQTNGPEDAITIPGYNATSAGDINLATPGKDVKTFSLNQNALPDNMTLQNTRVILTPADESEAKSTLPTTLKATEEGVMDSTALQELVIEYYGRKPVARQFNAHVYSNVVSNGEALYVDAGTITMNITPKAAHISKSYYLIGNMTDWNLDTTEKFHFTNSGADVYDDPIFTVTVTTTANDQYWKIIPQENVESGNTWNQGVLGVQVDGSTDMEGQLIVDNPQAGKIAEAGTYVISLNMLEYTYTITRADSYYMVGGVYGWNAEAASKVAFFNEGGSKASITTQWTGDANLKIWNRDNIGNWDVAWGSVTDGDNAVSGQLVNSGAGAIVCPEKGAYYTLSIDLTSKSYTWTKLDNQEPAAYTYVSLRGSFNTYNWNEDVDMVQTAPHNWYVRYTFNTVQELKFRANHDWSVSWGGDAKALGNMIYTETASGDNIKNLPAGTYDIYFNDITGKFMFVK